MHNVATASHCRIDARQSESLQTNRTNSVIHVFSPKNLRLFYLLDVIDALMLTITFNMFSVWIFQINFHTLDMQNCKNCEQNVFVWFNRFNQCCVYNGRCSLQLLFESFELYLSFCLVLQESQEFRWFRSCWSVNSKLTTHTHTHTHTTL